MLIVSILLSAALVVVIYNQHKNGGEPTWYAFCALAILTGLTPFMGVLPALWLHCLIVFFGALLWKWKKWSSQALRIYVICAALPGYIIAAGVALYQIEEHHRITEQNGFRSIEERLPIRKKAEKTPLTQASVDFLYRLESKVASDVAEAPSLDKLHNNAVTIFINSPGFGMTRMIPASSWPSDEEPTEPQIDQPGPPFMSTLSADDLKPADAFIAPGRELHLASAFDFVNVRGFGTVESRQKVLDLRPHRFTRTPDNDRLRVHAIELVGLVVHDEPRVYVSDKLPSMKDARKLPTRSLNTFEEAGLARLRQGDDIFARDTNEGVRMLGAIRSVSQCIQCHGGERGDLLGAFSYSLTRVLP